MDSKRFKSIESPTGKGEIRKTGEHIATVFYSLQVRQEIIVHESLQGKEEIPGMIEISGNFTVNEDERMQAKVLKILSSGELLTLYLIDGRRLDVYATNGDALSGKYKLVPGSPAGFVSG